MSPTLSASSANRHLTAATFKTAGRRRRLRTCVTALILLAELCRGASVWAQAPPGVVGDLDLEPPLIEHEQVLQADAGFRQRFIAQVVDDRELASVSLSWRFSGESRYARVAMNRLSSSSTWIGEVPTDPAESRSIEYFIEARDTGGNRTVQGFVFSPLVRRIIDPAPPPVDPADNAAEADPITPRSRTLYYVLGALAIGMIAGVASTRSSGGVDNRECGADGCDVVIRFEPPVAQ